MIGSIFVCLFPRYIKNCSVIINSILEVAKCNVWYTPGAAERSEFPRKSPNLSGAKMIEKGSRASKSEALQEIHGLFP